ALDNVELNAILNLNIDWKKLILKNDPSIYYIGNLALSNGETKKLLTVSSTRMGVAASSILTTKICLKFKPKYIFMSGICAGIKDKVGIGDIIIADPVWEWGSGKSTIIDNQQIHQPSPHQISIDASLRSELQTYSRTNEFLEKIYNTCNIKNKPKNTLKIHLGPMATGPSVLQDEHIVRRIRSSNKDILAIEMEAYGVLLAAETAHTPSPKIIIIKSVSDFADIDKNDLWQE
ncbi:hypothetical protein MKU80_020920, partial [Providencia rettgeri]|nr:hypothetical protein [Providencia rettgeri]